MMNPASGRRFFGSAILAMALSTPSLAQSFKRPPGEDGGGGGSMGPSYKAFMFSIPVVTATREATGRLELNLRGMASLALEGAFHNERRDTTDEDTEETGESVTSAGRGAALLFSRYIDPMNMAGLYWGLGIGYREQTVDWRVRPEEKDPQVDMRLVDDDNMLNHKARLSGTTGHIRAGYRYIGTSVPFHAGLYLGARHFQSGIDDIEVSSDDKKAGDAELAPLTDKEKERLRRRYATKPEAGIELGFAF